MAQALAGLEHEVELLRKESLNSLTAAAARRVLELSYTAVLTMAPLPGPPLPLSSKAGERLPCVSLYNKLDANNGAPAGHDTNGCIAGPTHFGPSAQAATPWLNLALYTAMAAGPVSLVLVKGQRMWRLPPFLQDCAGATVWLWSGAGKGGPVHVDGDHLLWSLNAHLSSSALLIQPQQPQAKVTSNRGRASIDGRMMVVNLDGSPT